VEKTPAYSAGDRSNERNTTVVAAWRMIVGREGKLRGGYMAEDGESVKSEFRE
jgi:hypothetical protein